MISFARYRFWGRVLLSLIILLFGVIAFFFLSSVTRKPESKKSITLLRSLTAIPIKVVPYKYTFYGYGTVRSSKIITVHSQVAGRVKYISSKLKLGEFVKRGELLLKIDSIDYMLVLKELDSQIKGLLIKKREKEEDFKYGLEILKDKYSSMKLDEADYLRKKKLLSQGAISPYTFEKSKKAYQLSRQQYIIQKRENDRSRLEIDSLKTEIQRMEVKKSRVLLDIKRCNIYSPIDGRIISVSCEVEKYVSIGATLFTIEDYKNLEIPVSVEIGDLIYLFDKKVTELADNPAQWFKRFYNLPVIIEWSNRGRVYKWNGRILRVDKFDAKSRTAIIAIAPMRYEGGKQKEAVPLVEGMFCKVIFKGRIFKRTVRIPWDALQIDGKIFLISKNKTIYEITPKIIASDGKDIIITTKGFKKDSLNIVAQRVPDDVVNGCKVNVILLNSW